MEECTECSNEFDPELDDGQFWCDNPGVDEPHFWEYICKSCVDGKRDKQERLEAAQEDYNDDKRRGL